MGVKNIIGGWRAVSLTKQPAIATAVVVNTLLPFMGRSEEHTSELQSQ